MGSLEVLSSKESNFHNNTRIKMQYTKEHHENLYGFRERDKFDYSVDIVFGVLDETIIRLH